MKKDVIPSIIFGLCSILLFTNCSGDPVDDGPTLSVQPTSITLEADGTGKTVSVTSNTSWSVRADDSWVKYSPTGGTGGSSITVSASVNTGDERPSKLILSDKTGRATAEVRITQKKGESSSSGEMLSVSPSNLNFSSFAGSKTFAIESNASWTVNSDQTWCTINTSSGSNNATITVNVIENTTTSARSATITVSSDKASSVQVNISQSGASPDIQLNKNDISFTAAGGSETFTVTSNTNWTVKSDQTWCTVSTSSGSNNGTITVSVLENTSTDMRSASIIVKAGDISQAITVSQTGASPTLQLDKSSMSFDSSYGDDIFSITSNTNWTAFSDQTWCTLSSSSGSNNATVTVYVSDNTSISDRSASVTVKASNLSQIITITQAGIGSDREYFMAFGEDFAMIRVEGGTFSMGATGEQGLDVNSDELPVHRVTLNTYYIGETEVDKNLWYAVMGNNPSYFGSGPRPVENVSWDDCQEFITKLNAMTGKTFRLPTEAEWEFAARGGNKSQKFMYAGSDNIYDVAWFIFNSGDMTQPVYSTSKSLNELGLYNMSGNVSEWCQDWYGSYSSSSQTNPTGPEKGTERVVRGGSYANSPKGCRISSRSMKSPDYRSSTIGFRLAL